MCLFIACKGDICPEPNSIYGYWESIDMDSAVAKPIGLKLDFHSPTYAFADYVFDDSICYYQSCIVRDDSLFLQYGDNTTKYHIAKFTDSILVLKYENNKYSFKKKYSYYKNGCIIQPKIKRGEIGLALDSLDIIVKSKYELDKYGQDAFVVTKNDMLKSKRLVLDYLDNKKYNSHEIYSDLSINTNDYVRQYFGIQEESINYIYVYLSYRNLNYIQGYMSWKESIIMGGGYTIKINLENNQVVDFYGNQHTI